MLWSMNEFVLFVVALVVFAGTIEIGFRLGFRHSDAGDDATRSHIGTLQSALLGLLALLLGFTFAMSVSRYDNRKSLVVQEANAIGTAHLRVKLLPASRRNDILAKFKAYMTERIAFLDAGADHSRLESAHAATSRIQTELWNVASSLSVQDAQAIPTELFIKALNEMFDISETHRVALENHVPEVVIHLLFIVSIIALGFIAYGSGLARKRRFTSTAIFALLIAIVLATILDVDRPRRGLIQVGNDSMYRLKAEIEN
ncbi:MAG: hypothetical protein WCT04_14265 [Planctomycetota bacterium]